MRTSHPSRASLTATFLSLPWCCIAPGVLSLIGVGSLGMARAIARELMPLSLAIGLGFIGRAYYLLYVKREGNWFSKITTWASTALLIGVSLLRFWPR